MHCVYYISYLNIINLILKYGPFMSDQAVITYVVAARSTSGISSVMKENEM